MDNRIVKQTHITGKHDAVVSTIMIAPGHYETCVFGGTMNEAIRTYQTIEAAHAGHREMVRIVMSKGI